MRPSLRRLQCRFPRRRREDLLYAYKHLEDQSEIGEEYVTVEYNGAGLLAIYKLFQSQMGHDAGYDEVTVYDLATGRPHQVAEWLRPAKKDQMWAMLLRLAKRSLREQHGDYQDIYPASHRETWPTLGLSADGIYCQLREVAAVPRVLNQNLTIPYAALAPYVRPGTPLARLVAARARPAPGRHQ